MKSNENSADRIIRVLLAVALGAMVALKIVTGIVAIIFGTAAVILFLTGIIGFCAIYTILAISIRCSNPQLMAQSSC